MKKLLMIVFVISMITINPVYGQESSFDRDLSNLRKNIIGMCAQLQAGKPRESQEQLLTEVDKIIKGWEKMAKVYEKNPPVEYADDPAWESYFPEAKDNFKIMQQKIEQENYKRAMQFCGMNCGLFTTIQEVNGIIKITIPMFYLRKRLKMIVSASAAENWNGASTMLENVNQLRNKIVKFPAPVGVDKKEHTEMMKKLSNAVDDFNLAVNNKGIIEVKSRFKALLKVFGPIYIKYI